MPFYCSFWLVFILFAFLVWNTIGEFLPFIDKFKNLMAGSYLITMETDEGKTAMKFIKNN
ncbi:Uncharacterised protein [Chryseobacterium indologenes]|nr:Uncharacterised protein [Chryseobacterium indologenes]